LSFISGRQKQRGEKAPEPKDILKMEIAAELGLLQKVQQVGWSGLSAAETGRIGGLMTKRMREMGMI